MNSDDVTRSGSMPYRQVGTYQTYTDIVSSCFKFKKNDTVKFKFRGKILTGNITKIGKYGVDVKSVNGYYYCHDFDNKGLFRKSNKTKNYS